MEIPYRRNISGIRAARHGLCLLLCFLEPAVPDSRAREFRVEMLDAERQGKHLAQVSPIRG